MNNMKAIVYEKYGKPSEVLELRDIAKPTPNDDEVLVKIHASSVNAGDVFLVTGKPVLVRLSSGLLKPKYKTPGGDIAGQIEAVGGNVSRFKPGDEVYGDIGAEGFGAYAEYVSAPESTITLKPANISFEEAAAVPQYGLVALQSLRDAGHIQSDHKVLINGASGGIGTFAVQIAKTYGAEVTGVCSTRNLELVQSLGSDHVIDYTHEDFTKKEQQYDLIIDIVANRPVSEYKRALNPGGRYVAVAFKPEIMFTRDKDRVIQFSHEPNVDDLVQMRELIEAGKVKPVIDKVYPLNEVAEALNYYVEGNPSGKVVIIMEQEGK